MGDLIYLLKSNLRKAKILFGLEYSTYNGTKKKIYRDKGGEFIYLSEEKNSAKYYLPENKSDPRALVGCENYHVSKGDPFLRSFFHPKIV